MNNALNAMWDQLWKDFDKLPGWVPLYALTLLFVDWLAPQDRILLWGTTIPLSRLVLAAALTLILYTAGDALDEAIYKEGPEGLRKTKKKYRTKYYAEASTAGGTMGIGDGLYAAALNLVTAAETYRGKILIHAPNEAAKCLRALILPLIAFAIPFFLRGEVVLAVTSLAAAVLLGSWYPQLKVWHTKLLYSAANDLANNANLYNDSDLGPVRLLFWDGKFVGSGRSAPKTASTATVGTT